MKPDQNQSYALYIQAKANIAIRLPVTCHPEDSKSDTWLENDKPRSGSVCFCNPGWQLLRSCVTVQ